MLSRRIWAGVGLALLGHLVTIGVPAGIALVGVGGGLWTWVGLLGQFALFVTCVTVGIVLIVRNERGIGLGLLVGWGVGVVVLPVIGFVIWIYVVSRTGFG